MRQVSAPNHPNRLSVFDRLTSQAAQGNNAAAVTASAVVRQLRRSAAAAAADSQGNAATENPPFHPSPRTAPAPSHSTHSTPHPHPTPLTVSEQSDVCFSTWLRTSHRCTLVRPPCIHDNVWLQNFATKIVGAIHVTEIPCPPGKHKVKSNSPFADMLRIPYLPCIHQVLSSLHLTGPVPWRQNMLPYLRHSTLPSHLICYCRSHAMSDNSQKPSQTC